MCVFSSSDEFDDTYKTNAKSVKITGDVTEIPTDAFKSWTKLVSAEIGSSVEIIGANSFGHCYSLASVNIGTNVKTIKNSAFQSCYSLKSRTPPIYLQPKHMLLYFPNKMKFKIPIFG